MNYGYYLKKLYIISLKYIPLIQTLVLILYIALPDLGQLKYILELIFGCSIVSGIRIATASKVLGFCKLHRIVIYYNCYSYIIIKLKQIFGAMIIFRILKPLHIAFGILLLLYALIDKVLLKRNKHYINFKNKIENKLYNK